MHEAIAKDQNVCMFRYENSAANALCDTGDVSEAVPTGPELHDAAVNGVISAPFRSRQEILCVQQLQSQHDIPYSFFTVTATRMCNALFLYSEFVPRSVVLCPFFLTHTLI